MLSSPVGVVIVMVSDGDGKEYDMRDVQGLLLAGVGSGSCLDRVSSTSSSSMPRSFRDGDEQGGR